MELNKMTALEIGRKIKSKELGVVEVTKDTISNIERIDKTYHAFVDICGERALKQAEEVQKKIDGGILTSPLAGVPMAVKDNMCTEGILTTCSSQILKGVKPTYSSTAALPLTLGAKTGLRAAPAAVRRRLLRLMKFIIPLVPIQADRYASRALFAE